MIFTWLIFRAEVGDIVIAALSPAREAAAPDGASEFLTGQRARAVTAIQRWPDEERCPRRVAPAAPRRGRQAPGNRWMRARR